MDNQCGATDMEGGKRRRRLNEHAWREKMRRFDAAAVTVGEFCKLEGVSDSSFHRWQSRLTAAPVSGSSVEREESPVKTPATFVDLGSLGATSTAMPARLELKLDLGCGLTLHLVRAYACALSARLSSNGAGGITARSSINRTESPPSYRLKT